MEGRKEEGEKEGREEKRERGRRGGMRRWKEKGERKTILDVFNSEGTGKRNGEDKNELWGV